MAIVARPSPLLPSSPYKSHLEPCSCPFTLLSSLSHPLLASCVPPPERSPAAPLLAVGASRRQWGVPDHLFLSLLRAQSSPELLLSQDHPLSSNRSWPPPSSTSGRRRRSPPPLPPRLHSLHPEHRSKVRNLIFPFVSHTPSRSTHRRSPELSRPQRLPWRPLRRSSHLHEPVVGLDSFHSSF
jgi:hypothetical protein